MRNLRKIGPDPIPGASKTSLPVGARMLSELAKKNELAIKLWGIANPAEFAKLIRHNEPALFSMDAVRAPNDRRSVIFDRSSMEMIADIRADVCASTKKIQLMGKWMYGNMAFEMFRVYHVGPGDGSDAGVIGWFWSSKSKSLIIRNPLTGSVFSMAYSSVRPAVSNYMRRIDITKRLVVRGIGRTVTSTTLLVPFHEIQEFIFHTKIYADKEELAMWKGTRVIRSNATDPSNGVFVAVDDVFEIGQDTQ